MSATPTVSAVHTATDLLKLVVGVAASPGGLSLATALLGVTNPAILLVEQFGVRLLGPLLATWTAPEISDADVAASLATQGYKVVPYDPMAGFSDVGTAGAARGASDDDDRRIECVANVQPTTVAELPRNSDGTAAIGQLVAVPLAPPQGDINVPAGTPVALIAQGFFQNKTIRAGLVMIGGAFSFFMGYIADQVVATQFFGGDISWYFDVLIVVAVGVGGICLALFWKTPVLARVRKAIGAGLGAFFGYVGFVIIENNGLDNLDFHKTMHTALNFGIVAAVGGVLIASKVFENNPVTGAPWRKGDDAK